MLQRAGGFASAHPTWGCGVSPGTATGTWCSWKSSEDCNQQLIRRVRGWSPGPQGSASPVPVCWWPGRAAVLPRHGRASPCLAR